MTRIAVLITCHNRRIKTLRCLRALFANSLPEGTLLHTILVDDGSTDGTANAVKERFPDVGILVGEGCLYWNGGMRVAFSAAMKADYDFYLWLNDDTLLYPDALARLLITADRLYQTQGKEAIVVGSTQADPDGPVTYGGVRRTSSLRPLKFSLVDPRSEAIECHTMNGNCVLIPSSIAKAVGNLEPSFTHTMGDLDYGLRAGKAGFSIWVVPGYAGTCTHNSLTGSWLDGQLPVFQRLRKLMQPKGLPPREWFVFSMRHAGWLGPAYWLWPYAKVLLSRFVR